MTGVLGNTRLLFEVVGPVLLVPALVLRRLINQQRVWHQSLRVGARRNLRALAVVVRAEGLGLPLRAGAYRVCGTHAVARARGRRGLVLGACAAQQVHLARAAVVAGAEAGAGNARCARHVSRSAAFDGHAVANRTGRLNRAAGDAVIGGALERVGAAAAARARGGAAVGRDELALQ